MDINGIVTKEELNNLKSFTANYLEKLIKDSSRSIQLLIFLLFYVFAVACLTLVCNYDLSWLIFFEIIAPFTIMLILIIKQLSGTAKTVYTETNINNSDEISISVSDNEIHINEEQTVGYEDVTSFFVPHNYIIINTKNNVSVPIKTDNQQQRQLFKELWKKSSRFIIAIKKEDGTAFRNNEISDSIVAYNRKFFIKKMFVCALIIIALVGITLVSVKLYKIANRPAWPSEKPFKEMYSACEDGGKTQDISDVYIDYMFDNYNAAIKSSDSADNVSKVEVYFFGNNDNVYSLEIIDYKETDHRYVQSYPYHYTDVQRCAAKLMDLEYITKTYPRTNNYNYYFLNNIVFFNLKNRNLFTADSEATYRFSTDKIEFSELCEDGENRFTIYLLNYSSTGEQAVNNYFENLEKECKKPYGLQEIDYTKIIGDIYAYSSY